MVTDPPEKHLRRHTLVDAVQQLFNKARACLSRCELQGTAIIELPLASAEPAPRASAVSEDLFPKRGNPSDAYGSI
jgi:hypothetical protein